MYKSLILIFTHFQYLVIALRWSYPHCIVIRQESKAKSSSKGEFPMQNSPCLEKASTLVSLTTEEGSCLLAAGTQCSGDTSAVPFPPPPTTSTFKCCPCPLSVTARQHSMLQTVTDTVKTKAIVRNFSEIWWKLAEKREIFILERDLTETTEQTFQNLRS